MSTTLRVGWIGTGVMGLSMAGHTLKAGFPLTVYSRTRSKSQPLLDKGAHWADSPADVARNSDVVFSIVGAFFVDGIISSLLVIASVVLSCMTYYKTGTAFGKGVGFGIGLILLNWLFILILGFSDAQYQGVPLKDGKARRDSDENEVTTQ